MKKRSDRSALMRKRSPDLKKPSSEAMRHFKLLEQFLDEPIMGPEGWAFFVRHFRILAMFAMSWIYEGTYPALTKCWHELEKYFMRREIFEDEIFIPAWIFLNLPLDEKHRTTLDVFEEFVQQSFADEAMSGDLQCFIDSCRGSRLGLYQEISSSSETMKFRELITGNTFTVVKSVAGYGKGEIFLTRLVKSKGQRYMVGDPKCYPPDCRELLAGTVRQKLYYFDGNDEIDRYEKFMTLAGPYWMSCVVPDDSFPILAPDHYLSYLK